MDVRKVWRVIKISSIPKGRRLVKSKWVFDTKRSGLFKVRLVACGYSQILGVDFTESYAAVINDVCWRTLVIAMLVQKLEAKIIDVLTAFLYGDLDEDIYMSCKEVHGEREVLLLPHAIYGLMQAARSFYLKFKEKLRKIGLGDIPIHVCCIGKMKMEFVFDDSLLVGHEKAI